MKLNKKGTFKIMKDYQKSYQKTHGYLVTRQFSEDKEGQTHLLYIDLKRLWIDYRLIKAQHYEICVRARLFEILQKFSCVGFRLLEHIFLIHSYVALTPDFFIFLCKPHEV